MKHLLVLVAFLALSTSAYSQVTKNGWKDLTWSMTEAQVKAKYPDAEPKIDVDGESFVLRFRFDDSNKLDRVNLVKDSPEFPEQTLQKMEKLLTEKYGKPSLKESGKKKLVVWNFKTLNVELMYSKNEVYSLLAISYIKPNDKAKSNL